MTNTAFALRNFKLAEPGSETNLVELSHFAVTGVSADAVARQAEIGCVSADGGKFFLLRQRELLQPMWPWPCLPNRWKPQRTRPAASRRCWVPSPMPSPCSSTAQISGPPPSDDVEFTNCAFHLEDLTTSRPARLDLDDIALSVKNISNDPENNLTAALSLRWNTNGTIKTEVGRFLLATDRRRPA